MEVCLALLLGRRKGTTPNPFQDRFCLHGHKEGKLTYVRIICFQGQDQTHTKCMMTLVQLSFAPKRVQFLHPVRQLTQVKVETLCGSFVDFLVDADLTLTARSHHKNHLPARVPHLAGRDGVHIEAYIHGHTCKTRVRATLLFRWAEKSHLYKYAISIRSLHTYSSLEHR